MRLRSQYFPYQLVQQPNGETSSMPSDFFKSGKPDPLGCINPVIPL
ncbi:MAG: hypothetical protein HC860_13280 [Alkalinema sp. RU_4_3]|nr:hypothetical protein [Alkalinema sp. RU_4_3]